MGSPSIQSNSRNKLNMDNLTQQFTEKKSKFPGTCGSGICT